jgi:amino acid transporter
MFVSDTREVDEKHKLRGQCLSFGEVLANSLGIMGISGSIVIVIPLIFAAAGNGACLALAVAMLAYFLVAIQINVFTSRIATAGSLYTFLQKGIGPVPGTIAGWALLLGYWFFVPVNIVAVSYYLCLSAYGLMGIPASAQPPTAYVAVSGVAIAAFSWWLTYRDIRLSTRVILLTEIATS